MLDLSPYMSGIYTALAFILLNTSFVLLFAGEIPASMNKERRTVRYLIGTLVFFQFVAVGLLSLSIGESSIISFQESRQYVIISRICMFFVALLISVIYILVGRKKDE